MVPSGYHITIILYRAIKFINLSWVVYLRFHIRVFWILEQLGNVVELFMLRRLILSLTVLKLILDHR